VAAIFSRLSVIFRKKWTADFSTEMDIDLAQAEWGVGLRGMSADQIKVALDRCSAECFWPPSSPADFRALGAVKLSACHKLFASELPKVKSPDSVVRPQLSVMRRAVG